MDKGNFQKLSDVCEFTGGSQPAKSNFVYDLTGLDKSEYARLIQIRDYKSDKHIVYILKSSTKKFCTKNDVMIGRYGPPVFQILRGLEGAYNVALMKATPKLETLNNDYLFYFLTSPSIQSYIIKLSERAAGQTGVNKPALHDFPILVPSPQEQKRIVTLLDTVFADLEQTRAKTEQNLKNARELFDSYLQQVFSNTRSGWVTTNLKKITSKIGSGATPRGGKAAYKTEGMSLIRSMNVHDRHFKKKDLALIDNDQAEKLSNVELQRNDVLLNITGASVARCCVVPEEYLPARVNQHVSIIRVNENTIKPELLCYLLTSKYYKDILLGIGEAGSTRQAITKVQLERFEISYPESMADQDEFIQQLTILENDVLKLHTIYVEKLAAMDELKKAILQKAFNGELTKVGE